MSRRVLFLPGASGAGAFWKPVADLLPPDWNTRLFDLPGCGAIPADPSVNSFDDLVALIAASIGDEPLDVIAQSMGGVVAMRLALDYPQAVRSLVLVATSGGVGPLAIRPGELATRIPRRVSRCAAIRHRAVAGRPQRSAGGGPRAHAAAVGALIAEHLTSAYAET